jgi:flagellar hook-length control protein FliK
MTSADTPDRQGNDTATSSGNGHGGRLDLQVQPAPRLNQAAPSAPTEAPVAPIDRDRLERLADGLAVRLRVSHAAEGARIRMQLEPRELGEVVVRLEIRDGVAHAHLIAESADAGRALSASLGDLRSALSDRGLQLDSVSVRVAGEGASNTSDGEAGQSQADRRRSPLTFGRLDPVAQTAATDTADRPREGQAVWMLA